MTYPPAPDATPEGNGATQSPFTPPPAVHSAPPMAAQPGLGSFAPPAYAGFTPPAGWQPQAGGSPLPGGPPPSGPTGAPWAYPSSGVPAYPQHSGALTSDSPQDPGLPSALARWRSGWRLATLAAGSAVLVA